MLIYTHRFLIMPCTRKVLLVNGATGIAVGMATNIPPHNLGEVVAATIGLIRNPDMPDDQLFRLLPAPDFPTGGEFCTQVVSRIGDRGV